MNTTLTETLARFASSDDPAAYVLSNTKLANNLSSIFESFYSIYPGVFVAYSFKTNYLKTICDKMRDSGVMAEVVSPAEYDYAWSLGFPPESIVYNGVIPDSEAKFWIAANNGYVNVDNIGELNEIAAIAREHHICAKLGVRVNFDVGNGIVSRFGVDVDSDEFKQIMETLDGNPNVRLGGFHAHIGSSRQLEYWERKADKMIELAKRWGAEYIDLGGGMFGQMPDKLSKQFKGYVPSFDRYADVVAGRMKRAFPKMEVALIIEPGTAMVGNTMKVAAKVTNIKRVQNKTFVTVGCCSNHIGMLCECRDIPVTVFHNPEVVGERIGVYDATVCGNTCLEFDYIKKGFTDAILPEDILVFENCGAYSISASRQFIVPRLPVYSEETGDLMLRGETSSDMLGKYYFCSKKPSA